MEYDFIPIKLSKHLKGKKRNDIIMGTVKFLECEDVVGVADVFCADELDKLMDLYMLQKGWKFDQDYSGESISGLTVTSPRGNVWTLDACVKEVSGKLEFANSKQIEAKEALDFYNILLYWGYSKAERDAEYAAHANDEF